MSEWRAFTDALARELERALEDVRARVRGPKECLAFRSDPEAWSNLEIGEHVALVNRYLLILADKIAHKSRGRYARGERPAGSPTRLDHLEKLASRDFKWASPAHMLPTGNLAATDIEAELGRQLERCHALLSSMPDGEGTLHRIRMSVVGEDERLDLYQFLCVIALHARRHAQAMRRNEEGFAMRVADGL